MLIAFSLQACSDDFSSCSDSRSCVSGASGSGGASGGSVRGSSGTGMGGAKAGMAALGDAGDAGTAGFSACGECHGANPVCDAAANACVECVKGTDCKAPKPACDTATNKCVECVGKGDCESPKPACDTAANKCVECIGKADCKDGAKPFCETAAAQCVACLKQADCTAPTASACAAGSCKPCTVDAECSDIAGKGVCDAGTCVQCTVAKESVCGGKSCSPVIKQCTTTPIGSKDLCEACNADSECISGNKADADTRCVSMKFMGTARPGGYCLRRKAKTCVQPYNILNTALSLSGAALEDYCGINQDKTRCEAVLDLTTVGAKCPDGKDTACGCARDKDGNCSETGQGGLCRMVGAQDNRCTFICGGPEQCPSGNACGGVGYCH